MILGSGLTGILGDSVNSQNAETQDSLGFGRLPKLTILQGSDGNTPALTPQCMRGCAVCARDRADA